MDNPKYIYNKNNKFLQEKIMALPIRQQIKSGMLVRIVLKENQRSGKLCEGIVTEILTRSGTHPHGIKVRLQDGKVGRVKEIVRDIV